MLKYIAEQEKADQKAASLKKKHPLKKGSQSMKPPTPPTYIPPTKSHPFMNIPQEQTVPSSNKRSKGPLEVSFQNEAREIADQDIARCVYANGLAFNVVRSP